jgi:peptidyl-prolyl cis-trans isomerase SurA
MTFASGAALALALAMPGAAQISVPRYHSPLDAPAKPQAPTMPVPEALTPDATVVEFPIARVNDAIIDSSDYQRSQQQLLEEAQRENIPADEVAQHQKDLLRDMIDTQLLLSRGKELDINADSEVIRRLDDLRKQNHFDTMEDLEKAVRQSGLSYEDFKQNIKNGIIQQEVERDEVARKITLSAKQEQAYYDAHKQDFAQPEQEQLSEILIPTPDDATDAQVAQAKAKADMVIAKLKAGGKFDELAKQYSGGTTADQGGPLGSSFQRGDGKLAKVIEDQVFALKAGEFTQPVRTKSGYLILDVTQHTQAGIQPLSAVDEQVQQAIYEEAMKPALRAYLTDLRDKAFIYILPGYVDTGASPKQTKSVFAAATPPPARKKAVKKARIDQARAKAAPVRPKTAPTAASPSSATLVAGGKKPKKIHREKIRFGQPPPESLPSAPEQTASAGTNQGEGATPSSLPSPIAALEAQQNSVATDVDLAAPRAPQGKTRYSDRAPLEAKLKAEAKAVKVKQKIAATPPPLTAEQTETQKQQYAPLGLGVDTATKKKKTKVKGAPKERKSQEAPAPPQPKPDATPIPPKSVRDNGEPAVNPAPSALPPANSPAPGTAVDTTTPATPSNPAPAGVVPQ